MEVEFVHFTKEQLEWLNAHFDEYQDSYHRKWKELADRLKEVFAIPAPVKGPTVRNKLLSYWVCYLLWWSCGVFVFLF